jgi:hypothetical protein
MPEVASHPGPVGIFLGSSTIASDVLPPAFDAEYAQQGHTITTYNFGVPGTDGRILHIIARRLSELFTKRRADLVVLEFMPFQARQGRDDDPGRNHVWLQYRSLLMSPYEVAVMARRRPGDAASIVGMHLLGLESYWASDVVADCIWKPAPPSAVSEYRAAPRFVWDPAQRGGRAQVATDAIFLERIRRNGMKGHREEVRRSFEKDFDDNIVSEFVAAFRELAPWAARSYLIMLPTWLGPLPEADDFIDPLHLVDATRFSTILAKKIAEDAGTTKN